jgi:hypothetical protein
MKVERGCLGNLASQILWLEEQTEAVTVSVGRMGWTWDDGP